MRKYPRIEEKNRLGKIQMTRVNERMRKRERERAETFCTVLNDKTYENKNRGNATSKMDTHTVCVVPLFRSSLAIAVDKCMHGRQRG